MAEYTIDAIIPTFLAAAFAIYLTLQLGIDSFKYYNIGFYLMWLGTISLIAFSLVHKKDDESF